MSDKQLTYLVGLLIVFQSSVAAYQVYVATFSRNPLFNGITVLLLCLGAVGLSRRLRWGYRITVGYLYGCILVGIGSMSPFLAGDLIAAGIEPPSVWKLLAQFFAICAVAISCLHLLGKHKLQFRSAWW